MSRQQTSDSILQGTLDVLILKTLSLGENHGWAIAERIQQVSGDVLRVNQGSLYPALYRLERQRWISSAWDTSDNNRRAKYYALTAKGRRHLEAETDRWKRFAEAVNLVLALGEAK